MSGNVLWFSDLGLADLEQVGGKSSSLGERVSNLSGLGIRVPDASQSPLRHTAGFSARPGWQRRSATDWPAWTPTTCRSWPEPGSRSGPRW